MKHTFYAYITSPVTREKREADVNDFAVALLQSQLASAPLIKNLFDALKDLEGVNNDITKDVIDTRINRVHKLAAPSLMALIELHNARSHLCTTVLHHIPKE